MRTTELQKLTQTKPAVDHATRPTDWVQLHDPKKTVVVYNPFSIEAIIAASLLKKKFANYQIISVADHIHVDAANYVWIGVNESNHLKRRLRINKAVHHSYGTHDAVPRDETGYMPTVIERVCLDHGIPFNEPLAETAHFTAKFYTLGMTLDKLTFVYNKLHQSLHHLGIAAPAGSYIEIAEMVKKRLNDGYSIQSVIDGSTPVRVIMTTMHDFSYAVALRLIRLQGMSFVNISDGANGPIVYTNLVRPVLTGDKTNALILN